MKNTYKRWALGLVIGGVACGEPPPDNAEPQTASMTLLDRAVAFHDPNAHWGRSTITINWTGTGSDGSERSAVQFVQYADGSKFDLVGRYRGSELEYHTDSTSWTATVDGSADLDSATLDRMGLRREDGFLWRSYYGFLSGMPMKLNDPGTLVDPDPVTTTFEGKEVLSIKVTFDSDVGGDTWYFYLDPQTAELVGCRFYHDESANDGEYITFEGLTESEGLRLPRHRRWYVNADDRYLGTDEVRSLSIDSPAEQD